MDKTIKELYYGFTSSKSEESKSNNKSRIKAKMNKKILKIEKNETLFIFSSS